jgi:3-(3-hydroxy-phenyl)propionate hydroxylase
VYLIRPDQHVCARWRQADAASIEKALARATGKAPRMQQAAAAKAAKAAKAAQAAATAAAVAA